VGEAGRALRLVAARPLPAGQALVLEVDGRRRELELPLPGRFQADNALLAAGLALAVGLEDVVARLATLRGVRGRMELAAEVAGAAIYVDYAHTPDALERLLAALRPHVAPGGQLHVVFGAGGDRDPGKRPLMGAAAAAGADQAWITDDNPRHEDPAAIRAAILAACPGGRDAGPREQAIAAALEALRPGDVLAVAGKGHESGQTIAGVTTPFDDAESSAASRACRHEPMDRRELRAATGGACPDGLAADGISIDTRSLAPGDLFVALRAERDGHDFVAPAFAQGAAAMVDRDVTGGPVLRVADTLAGLTALGAAGRARSGARVIAVTGSVGKTTTKEMLRRACAGLGPTHAASASHNNHWGVPLTLARMPRATEWAAIELGMNRRGEIAPLSRLARPHVALVTNVGTAHIGNLGSAEAIADEKADIAAGLAPGGIAILPRDSAHFERMAAAWAAMAGACAASASTCRPRRGCISYAGSPQGGQAEFDLGGQRVQVALAQPGRHMALNALAALAAIQAAGGDVARAAAALDGFGAGAGRGEIRRIATPDGGTALLLDEATTLRQRHARRARRAGGAAGRRRLAVLGDMLEMGDFGPPSPRRPGQPTPSVPPTSSSLADP
jgi:UDP-N-acetylmuramoyl-tripeptide--D-alanyl-D-alanine ligase